MSTVNRVESSQSLRNAARARRVGAGMLLAGLLIGAMAPACGAPWVQPAVSQPAHGGVASAPAGIDDAATTPAGIDDDPTPATVQAIAVLLGGATPAPERAVDATVGELPLAGLLRLVTDESQRLGSPVDASLFTPRPPAAGDAPLLVDVALDALSNAPNRDLLQALAAPPPWQLLGVVGAVLALGVLVALRRRHAHRRRRREHHHGHRHGHRSRQGAQLVQGGPAAWTPTA